MEGWLVGIGVGMCALGVIMLLRAGDWVNLITILDGPMMQTKAPLGAALVVIGFVLAGVGQVV